MTPQNAPRKRKKRCPLCGSTDPKKRKQVQYGIDKVDYWMYYKGPCDDVTFHGWKGVR